MCWVCNTFVVCAIIIIVRQWNESPPTPPTMSFPRHCGDNDWGPLGDSVPEVQPREPGTYVSRVGAWVGPHGQRADDDVAKRMQKDARLLNTPPDLERENRRLRREVMLLKRRLARLESWMNYVKFVNS